MAGGIGLENAEEALNMTGLKIHAIDINSRFELSPAMKDIEKVQELMYILKPDLVEV